MRILIGAVTSIPPFSPGITWDWIQYAVGLQRLGHEVYYLEEVEPRCCLDSRGDRCRLEDSVNQRWFRAAMERFDMMDRACQIYNGGDATFGLSMEALATVCRGADLLLNISGHVKSDLVLGSVRRRVYVDQDPVYTQLWRVEYGQDLSFDAHDAFLTVGLNIGTPHSHIPDAGVEWRHVLPPIVLDHWPVSRPAASGRFTTIASWVGFGDLSHGGEWYRSKDEEFRRFAGLPGMVDQGFEAALRRHAEDDAGVQLLRSNGWIVTESGRIDGLSGYQDYIARSRAEIGITKNAYVKGRSGWFSDRTSHYLASGRPALVQATGFERRLPTGQGLLTFDTMESAVEGVQRINHDYDAHCKAAREFAEEHLDYRVILPRMLQDCCT